jgi:hypothetical protein
MATEVLDALREPTAAHLRCVGDAIRSKTPGGSQDEGQLEVFRLAHAWGKSQTDIEAESGVSRASISRLLMVGKPRDPWMPDIPDLLRRVIGAIDAADAAFDQTEIANGQMALELANLLSDKADLSQRIRDVVCQGGR